MNNRLPEDEKPFVRWMDKTARIVGIDTPRYYLRGLKPHTVEPSEQKAWYDNERLCIERDLRNLFIGERANVNGHIVERIVKGKHGERYLIGGIKYTFEAAVAAVTAQAGGREAE